jgi:hypothetical protein
MNVFGAAHGMSLAALIFALTALPFSLLAGYWRLSRRAHLAFVLAFGVFAITGSAIFLTLDAQAGSLLGVVLWLVLIGGVVYTTCWGWKRAHRPPLTEGAS